jgi:ornithine cyclodeaminase
VKVLNKEKMLKVLNKEEVLKCIDFNDALIEMENAFLQLYNKNVILPIRNNFETKFGSSFIMPSYLKESSSMGLKMVSIRNNNLKKFNLPNVPATICLMDEETGLPNCFMNASELTAIRTAIGSAIATKYLSNKDSKKLIIFGKKFNYFKYIKKGVESKQKVTFLQF